MNNKLRKEQLKKLALKKGGNGGRIYQLLNSNVLDNVIDLITDEKTPATVTSIIKNGYLTGNEQFLEVLDEFIYYFDSLFVTVEHKDMMIQMILETQIPEFLLAKKYWGDNSFIPYYQFNINKTIIYNFYISLQRIYEHIDVNILKNNHINKKMNLDSPSDVKTILKFMQLLAITNFHDYSIMYLFYNYDEFFKQFKERYSKKDDHEIEEILIRNFVNHFDMLFDNFNKKKEFAEKLLF